MIAKAAGTFPIGVGLGWDAITLEVPENGHCVGPEVLDAAALVAALDLVEDGHELLVGVFGHGLPRISALHTELPEPLERRLAGYR